MEITGNLVDAAKALGAGLAMIGVIGPGIGIGLLVQGALNAIGRTRGPGQITTRMILGIRSQKPCDLRSGGVPDHPVRAVVADQEALGGR